MVKEENIRRFTNSPSQRFLVWVPLQPLWPPLPLQWDWPGVAGVGWVVVSREAWGKSRQHCDKGLTGLELWGQGFIPGFDIKSLFSFGPNHFSFWSLSSHTYNLMELMQLSTPQVTFLWSIGCQAASSCDILAKDQQMMPLWPWSYSRYKI